MVDCKESKLRYRADQLFWARADVDGETLGYVSVLESGEMEAEALAMANKMKKKASAQFRRNSAQFGAIRRNSLTPHAPPSTGEEAGRAHADRA